ncbi:MAG: roadblock/LC7 domain-containing protein [Candidatus Thorarchaeota archaeon]
MKKKRNEMDDAECPPVSKASMADEVPRLEEVTTGLENVEITSSAERVAELEEVEVPHGAEIIMEPEEVESLPVKEDVIEPEEVKAHSAEKDAVARDVVKAPPKKKRRQSEEPNDSAVKDFVADPEGVEVPPVKEIREKLSSFEMKVPVWGLTVFTVDGYIIAHKLFYDAMPEEIGMAISSMSAGLVTISEDFIRMVDSGNMFRQVLVDSERPDGAVSFSILLKSIAENVLIACIFPSSTQLGLVTFEIENLGCEILDIVNRWDVKLHEDTVT